MKSGEGGVVETSWMFQAASPASIHPARSPTRGSGLGAAVEKGRWDGAQAATDNATIANNAFDFTEGSLKGHRASGSCGRSRWSGRRSRRRRTGTRGRTRTRLTSKHRCTTYGILRVLHKKHNNTINSYLPDTNS